MIVYVVSVPWDSASVRNTYVFECEEDAEEFCDRKNEEGYNGYCNGLKVERVEIIKTLERD